jgi:DNA topoisomerase-2
MSTTDINLANKYQQKTDKQHILDNPDTYIGSVEEIDSNQWIITSENGNEKIIEKNIKYIPGLFKLFDEGIVNCRDHVVRMLQSIANGQTNCLPVTNIEVTIDDDGTITMLNDGNGIDVAEHPEHKMWIPEMIFGHLEHLLIMIKQKKRLLVVRMGSDSNLY